MSSQPIDPNARHEAVLRDIGGEFHLSRVNRSATLQTVGVREDPEDESNALFNAAVNGLESLLLALYAAGIDVTSTDAVKAINTALSALGDHYSYD
jgi:hypothetical protein